MDLTTWASKYLSYKNSMSRKKEEIKLAKNKVYYGDKKFICNNNLSLAELADVLVCNNNKENFDFLLKNWDQFTNKDVKIFFVNPKTSSHWAIYPKHHSKIVEKKELKKGLQSLYENSS